MKEDKLTLLTEGQVWGWNPQDAKTIELLKKCNVPGNYRGEQLGVFEKHGIQSTITDMAILTAADYSYDKETNEPMAEFTFTQSKAYTKNYTNVVCITPSSSGGVYRTSCESNSNQGVIRPVLDSEKALIQINELDDSDEVEYGEYPQYAASLEMQGQLEEEYQQGNLKEAGGSYSFNSVSYMYTYRMELEEYPVYEYEGKKYIRMKVMPSNCRRILSNGKEYDDFRQEYVWIEVAPVKWLLDRETGLLVSKHGLVSGLCFDQYRTNFSGLSGDVANFLGVMLRDMTQYMDYTKDDEIKK